MRRIFFLMIAILVPNVGFAAEKSTSSVVDLVTVFLSGAEVTRSAKVELESGPHTVIIDDVPANIVQGSIRVEGKATGKLEIVSVDTQRKFLQREESRQANVARKEIEDQIESLQDNRAAIEAQITAAETQAALIANLAELPNRPAPPAGAPASEDWTRIMSIIAQGTADASRLKKEAEVKLRAIDRQVLDLNAKLASLAPAQTEQTEVRVNVVADSQLEADFTIRYQVRGARWTPLYDARLTTATKTDPANMSLSRRAAITQNTGEKWENVTVRLSTARPSDGAAAPELAMQTVDYETPPKIGGGIVGTYSTGQRAVQSASEAVADVAVAKKLRAVAPVAAPPAPAVEQIAEVIEAPFEATFAVPGKVTIEANGEVKRVALLTDVFEPTITSRTVPKFDTNAYIYATFSAAKGTPLLPGMVYLFRDGTFVGVSKLPLLSPGVEHHLGFGIDDQVKVRFAVLEEKLGETGLISTSRTDSRNFRVTVKNLHATGISVRIFDRVPVSKNEEIKVEVTGSDRPSKMDIDDRKGVFVFEEDLNADEERVFDYGYRVVWPAGKSVEYSR